MASIYVLIPLVLFIPLLIGVIVGLSRRLWLFGTGGAMLVFVASMSMTWNENQRFVGESGIGFISGWIGS
jgi:hypothetical protein